MGMKKTSIALLNPETSVLISKRPFYGGTLSCLLHLGVWYAHTDGVLPAFAMYRGSLLECTADCVLSQVSENGCQLSWHNLITKVPGVKGINQSCRIAYPSKPATNCMSAEHKTRVISHCVYCPESTAGTFELNHVYMPAVIKWMKNMKWSCPAMTTCDMFTNIN